MRVRGVQGDVTFFIEDRLSKHPKLDAFLNRLLYTGAFTYGVLSECVTMLRRQYKVMRIRRGSGLMMTTAQIDLLLDIVRESRGFYSTPLTLEERVAIKMTLARRGLVK